MLNPSSLSLTTWHEQLPPQLVITSHSTKNLLPHILMMHLSWAWLSVLLHRPFYRPTAKLPGQTGKQAESEGYNASLAIRVSIVFRFLMIVSDLILCSIAIAPPPIL